MRRNRYCIANWKMNHPISEAKIYISDWQNKELNNSPIKTIFCPSFTELFIISEMLKASPSELGAQNVFYDSCGAFTGEVSCNMLKEVDCKWVIIGHSERRHIMGESNNIINRKMNRVISDGLYPILCVGESKKERNDGRTDIILKEQLELALNNIDRLKLINLIIAYEPVWAIGSGVNANPEEIQSAHSVIRNYITNIGIDGNSISIVYGGSVSVNNASSLSKIDGVDGFLIGGASLEVDNFYSIYKTL
tara:strand:- start:3963 stop:4712 length:750 start_codon:yes stop_codon:yes gene_type:complete